jgi:hypothetical protein
MSPRRRSLLRSPLAGVLVALVALLLVAGVLGRGDGQPATSPIASGRPTTPIHPTTGSPSTPSRPPTGDQSPYVVVAHPPFAARPQLPGGGYQVFGHHRFLVAYYGTAQTGAMGVLG